LSGNQIPGAPHRRALVVGALAQLALLLLHDFGRDPAGNPLQASPIVALGIRIPLYALPLLGITTAWAAARVAAWHLRNGRAVMRMLDYTGIAVTGANLGLVIIDLGFQRFRGEPLAWHHLAAYASPNIGNTDWIAPVLDHPALLAGTLGIAAAAGFALVRRHGGTPYTSRREPLVWALALPVAWGLSQLAWYHQRDMLQAPVLRLWATRQPPAPWPRATEHAAGEALRRALDPLGRDRWLSEQYPLWRQPGVPRSSPVAGNAVADSPDIIVLAIESLRGRDTGWGYGGRRGAASPTPQLDALADSAVRYPTWMAGGDPSPRGFITLHTGTWEHEALFITANFPALRVDAFPQFLRRRGYRAVALWSASPSFDNQLTYARRWYDATLFDREQAQRLFFHAVPDSVTVDRATTWIQEHDATTAGRPFVMYLATNGTHTPFAVPTGQRDPQTRQGRYDLALRDTDRQLGRLIAQLRTRARWRNTVVLVVGDHSDRTDDVEHPDLRGLPTDPLVVTSAFLFGPARLIGAPRTDSAAVGHLDWFATVRAWFADSSAGVWMGRDLFDTSAAPRWAVAVNSRGLRLETRGRTVLAYSGTPTRGWVRDGAVGGPLQPLETHAASDSLAARSTEVRRHLALWARLIEANRVLPAPR
jgi:arylsulfatase A-like enzyme